jgi:MSHA biogenesis protein MshM
MYHSHFGLDQSPFSITPNPAFFYSGSQRGDILEALIYAVIHGEGIIKVTGEVGSGKTMLCRMLEGMMPANVVVIYLVNPTLSRAEVVFAIAGELEIDTAGKRPDEVIRLLQSDLIAKHINGKQVVLLVEEAQAMPLDTLEEIRLFSNLETSKHKLLQIVLFGQPELDENLNLPSMRQLKERITHSFKVPPMMTSIIPEFLMFRMRAAGYHGPDIFSKAAIKLLSSVSEGIVRRINILADKALLAAFADNTHLIEVKHVKEAIRDSEFSTSRAGYPHSRLLIGLALGLALLIAADIGWRTYLHNDVSTRTAQLAAVQKSASGAVIATPLINVKTAALDLPHPSPISSPLPIATTEAAESSLVKTDIVAKKPDEVSQILPKAPIERDIFQKRLDASKNWLRDTPQDYYTVQLALVDAANSNQIKQLLKKLGDEVGIEQLYLYPTRIGGLPRFGIVYSSFASRDEVLQDRIELERKLNNRGQLRTIAGLRLEMRRFRSEDLWPK